MKVDAEGREIRRLATLRGLRCEIEIIPHFSGERMRLWWLLDRVGRAPMDFPGGVDDESTLNFLQGERKP